VTATRGPSDIFSSGSAEPAGHEPGNDVIGIGDVPYTAGPPLGPWVNDHVKIKHVCPLLWRYWQGLVLFFPAARGQVVGVKS
jgi:hypothetical protein